MIAIIAALFVAGAGAVYTRRQPRIFFSAATVMIDQPKLLFRAENPGIVEKLSQLRLKYAGIARTSIVYRPVAERLDLPEGLVRRAISLGAIQRTLLMLIQAQARTPKLSQSISQAAAEELMKYAKAEQDSLQIPDEQKIVFTILDPALPGVKISPRNSRVITVTATSGILTLLVVFIGARLLSTRPRLPVPEPST